MLGRIPKQKGIGSPFFWGMFSNNTGWPTQRSELNYQKLRQLSEHPIPRRAIRYIKSQVSRLDKKIVPKEGVKLSAREKRIIDSLNSVLNSPNYDDTWVSMCEKWVEDLLVIGWSTTVVKEWREKPEHPLLLFPSDAASFSIYLDWNGSPKSPRYAQFDLRGNKVDFLPTELFVIKHDARTADPFGIAPMAICADEVEYLMNAMAYAGDIASKRHPKKLLHMGEDADESFIRETRVYWKDEVEGRGTLPIVGGTKSPTSVELGADTDESLFLKWQNQLITLIANSFGLDPQKFGIMVGINRSTGDTLDDVSDEGAIRPVAKAIETAINTYFLRRFDLYDKAEFRFQWTTSNTDRKALATIHQIMLQDDEMTINEARREMGLDPLPNDDESGKSKGDFTLSEYRAKFGGQKDISEQMGPNGEILGGEQGGNNGVNGAAKPKDKAMNQGKEKVTDKPKPAQ